MDRIEKEITFYENMIRKSIHSFHFKSILNYQYKYSFYSDTHIYFQNEVSREAFKNLDQHLQYLYELKHRMKKD